MYRAPFMFMSFNVQASSYCSIHLLYSKLTVLSLALVSVKWHVQETTAELDVRFSDSLFCDDKHKKDNSWTGVVFLWQPLVLV